MLYRFIKLGAFLFFHVLSVYAAPPHLITEPNSARAIALESPSFKAQPFRLTASTPLAAGLATRVMVFAEGIDSARESDVLLVARDAGGTLYTPAVEFLGDLPAVPGIRSIVFALDSSMTEGDLTLGLYFNSQPSNAVLIAVVHQGSDMALFRTYQIVCDGNSLTAGNGASSSDYNYPNQLNRFLTALGAGILLHNVAVSGQTTPQMLSDVGTQVDPLFDPKFDRNVVVAWEGTNHLWVGATGQEAYQALVEYCAGRKAAGFRVLVLTVLPRADATTAFEDGRIFVNANLRMNWRNYADGIVDVAADPRFLDIANETYYSKDRQHLNDNGYRVIAQLVGAAILRLGA